MIINPDVLSVFSLVTTVTVFVANAPRAWFSLRRVLRQLPNVVDRVCRYWRRPDT
jgi:hypothetical protein